jgi:hypothetical protein
MKYEQNENRLDQVRKPGCSPMMAVTETLTSMEQVLEMPVISVTSRLSQNSKFHHRVHKRLPQQLIQFTYSHSRFL